MPQELDTNRTYKKRYRLNIVGKFGYTTTVAIPPEVINLKAEQAGLTPDEFIRRYQAVAQYDNFEGVVYTFEEIQD